MRLISHGAHEDPVRVALTRFTLLALASAVAIGAVGVWLFQDLGTTEAIRDTKELTEVAGKGIVEPALTDALLGGDRRALERVDFVVRERVLGDAITHVKIWTRDGRVVYSDEPRLIGERFDELDESRIDALETGRVDTSEADLSEEEHRYTRDEGRLLEVFLPVTTPSGQRLLFETHFRYSAVDQIARRTWRDFAPALLGGLLLYALIQLPLAWQLARRVRESRRERERLLRRAIEASEIERRRIAHDLHDGVVQNLAGVSYSLAATAKSAPPGLAPTLQQAAGETRQAIRELRTLLVEIYPPELQREGLRSALTDLLAPCARKMETRLEIDQEARLPHEVEAFFFRVAQEALRNVVKHANATRVAIEVGREGPDATLVVADDGQGFDPAATPEGNHFGLRLLSGLAAEAGGSLEVDSAHGRGARVKAVMPVDTAAEGVAIAAVSASASSDRDPRPSGAAREALRQVVDAHELERRRLARELHDETGQALTSILLGLKTAEETDEPAERGRALAEVRALVGETLQNVRRLAVELRPKALDDFGLEPALERLAEGFREQTGIPVELESQLSERLPPEVETLLYRVAQEALTNVVKHAQATTVSIVLSRRDGRVTALIEDDGRGFPADSENGGAGLSGLRERLELLDGNLRVESRPGRGTTLVVDVPA